MKEVHCERKRGGKPSLLAGFEIGGIQTEINRFVVLFGSHHLVEFSIPSLLKEKITVKSPEEDDGKIGNENKFQICLVGGKGEQRGNQRDRPPFDHKGIGVHAGDDVLNELQMF